MGGLLMAVGGMIAALCGACTLFFVADSLTSRGGEFSGPGMLPLVLPMGGIPTVVGGLIAWWGWRLYRPRRTLKPDALRVFSDRPPEAPDE
jgi:hypothetical protein